MYFHSKSLLLHIEIIFHWQNAPILSTVYHSRHQPPSSHLWSRLNPNSVGALSVKNSIIQLSLIFCRVDFGSLFKYSKDSSIIFKSQSSLITIFSEIFSRFSYFLHISFTIVCDLCLSVARTLSPYLHKFDTSLHKILCFI